MPVKTKVLIEHTDDSCSSQNNRSIPDSADLEEPSSEGDEMGSMMGECNLPVSLALDGDFEARRELANEYVDKLFNDYLVEANSRYYYDNQHFGVVSVEMEKHVKFEDASKEP